MQNDITKTAPQQTERRQEPASAEEALAPELEDLREQRIHKPDQSRQQHGGQHQGQQDSLQDQHASGGSHQQQQGGPSKHRGTTQREAEEEQREDTQGGIQQDQ